MEVLDYYQAKAEVDRAYDRKTTGWSAFLSRGKKGFYNWLFVGPEGIWQIKTDTIYGANVLGKGAKLDFDSEKVNVGGKDFGYRPLPLDKIIAMGEDDLDEGALEKLKEEVSRLMRNPTRLRSIRTPVVLEGPYDISRRALVLGEAQAFLDERLEREVMEMFRSRFPQYR